MASHAKNQDSIKRSMLAPLGSSLTSYDEDHMPMGGQQRKAKPELLAKEDAPKESSAVQVSAATPIRTLLGLAR